MDQNFDKTMPLKGKLKEEDWGSVEWLVDESLIPGADMSLARVTLKTGKTSPDHRHPNCHEMIYVLAGELEENLDGKKLLLKEGDSVFIPLGTVHGSRNAGSGEVQLLISYSEGKRIYEPA